jgi:hypothetical protein
MRRVWVAWDVAHRRLFAIGPSSFSVILGERRSNKSGHDAAALSTSMPEHVAYEVDAAALPCGVQNFCNGSFDAFMRVGDHQLDPAPTAPRQLAQERGPERFGLGRADVHLRNLTPAVALLTPTAMITATDTMRPF